MANFYIQRIFDIGLNAYVQYTTAIPTVTPVPATTSPVGIGPYNPSTHTIVSRYDNPTQDILGGISVDTPLVSINPGDTIIWDGSSFEPGISGGGGGIGGFVWAPGFPSGDIGNVYTTWATLYAAVLAAPIGSRNVLCIETYGTLTVPAGSWRLRGWVFSGPRNPSLVDLAFADGATIDTNADSEADGSDIGQRYEFRNLTVTVNADVIAPLFVADTQVHSFFFYNCELHHNGGALPFVRIDPTIIFSVYMYNTAFTSDGGIGAIEGTGAGAKLRLFLFDGCSIDGDLITDTGTPGDLEATYTYDGSSTYIINPSDFSMDAAWVIWKPSEQRRLSFTGCTNTTVGFDILAPEVVVGGFMYNPSDTVLDSYRGTWDKEIRFAAMASAPTASTEVRLYDIGTVGSPAAGTLVSTITVLSTDGASISAAIAVDAGGSPGTDTVAIGLRLYEIRVVADVAEDLYIYWAGMRVNDSGGA